MTGYQMIDVGGKAPTRRRALAQGRITMGPEAFAAVRDRKLPKGDCLALAEVAGILAAKRAPEQIPLCHPLPLEKVDVRFELDEASSSVLAFCDASAFAKTGVEMEALAGVNGALLAIYDLVKQVDPALSISDVRLNVKEGGKSGTWTHPATEIQTETEAPKVPLTFEKVRGTFSAAVITVSDRASRGEAQDVSGPLLASLLEAQGARVIERALLPDEPDAIAARLRDLADASDARLVVLTGGTGLSPRDRTPEAVQSVCDRMIPGFGEKLRASGAEKTPLSWLSRSCAGLRGRLLIIALPGSPKAVREGVEALSELLPHALEIASGHGEHRRV